MPEVTIGLADFFDELTHSHVSILFAFHRLFSESRNLERQHGREPARWRKGLRARRIICYAAGSAGANLSCNGVETSAPVIETSDPYVPENFVMMTRFRAMGKSVGFGARTRLFSSLPPCGCSRRAKPPRPTWRTSPPPSSAPDALRSPGAVGHGNSEQHQQSPASPTMSASTAVKDAVVNITSSRTMTARLHRKPSSTACSPAGQHPPGSRAIPRLRFRHPPLRLHHHQRTRRRRRHRRQVRLLQRRQTPRSGHRDR